MAETGKLYLGGKAVTYAYLGEQCVYELITEGGDVTYTFRISNYSSGNYTINGASGAFLTGGTYTNGSFTYTAPAGTFISYRVEPSEGSSVYAAGTATMMANATVNLTLQRWYSFNISVSPSNSYSYIYALADGYPSWNYYNGGDLPSGTTIHWTVYGTGGYSDVAGTTVLSGNSYSITQFVTMSKPTVSYTFTIYVSPFLNTSLKLIAQKNSEQNSEVELTGTRSGDSMVYTYTVTNPASEDYWTFWAPNQSGYSTQMPVVIDNVSSDVTKTATLSQVSYTVRIIPVPSDATVTINGSATSAITAHSGDTVSYRVSKSGYNTENGTLTVGGSVTTIERTISLTEAAATIYQVNFLPKKSGTSTYVTGVTIYVNGMIVDEVVNAGTPVTYSAAAGSAVAWSASCADYTTASGSFTLTGNTTVEPQMVYNRRTLTVNVSLSGYTGAGTSAITYNVMAGNVRLVSSSVTTTRKQFIFSWNTGSTTDILFGADGYDAYDYAFTASNTPDNYTKSISLQRHGLRAMFYVYPSDATYTVTAGSSYLVPTGEESNVQAGYRHFYFYWDSAHTATISFSAPYCNSSAYTLTAGTTPGAVDDFAAIVLEDQRNYLTVIPTLTDDTELYDANVTIISSFGTVSGLGRQTQAFLANESVSAITGGGDYTKYGPYSLSTTQTGQTFVRRFQISPISFREKYLTFEIISGGTIYWYKASAATARAIQYSKNDGAWTDITSAAGTATISVSTGDVIRFKGTNSAYGGSTDADFSRFSGSTSLRYEAYGNIMSLVAGDAFSGATTNSALMFKRLFHSATGLIDASNLVIPAGTTYRQYYEMFKNCTNLVSAPKNIGNGATTSTPSSGGTYYGMFYGCTSMTTAPAMVPNLTLGVSACTQMFYNCTSLVGTPAISATTLNSSCCSQMFQNCTALLQNKLPKLPATTMKPYCYDRMFAGCTNIVGGVGITLPATTLAAHCYDGMFSGCTSLGSAPTLPALSLEDGCYNNMFRGCQRMESVRADFTDTPGSSYTDNWLYGVADAGTFYKNRDATWSVYGPNGIPAGWTIIQN